MAAHGYSFLYRYRKNRTREPKSKKEEQMATKEFDAHEWKKQPEKVKFKTHDGKTVSFKAEVPKRVPVHVKFKTKS
jgi:hypothetical protein